MGINLDKRIRKDHPLRKIRELIDFDFIYKEVEDKYGYNGNESIPPPIILKLMLLLVLKNRGVRHTYRLTCSGMNELANIGPKNL